MTGALSLPLTIAALIVPTAPQKVLFAVLAIVCFVHSSYRVWAAEYDRANAAERKLADRRPRVVPEVILRDERSDTFALLVSNVGGSPALDVSIREIGAADRTVTFDSVQLLRPEDGKVEVRMRFTGSTNLREVIGFQHLVATLRAQRGGQPPVRDEFEFPLVLTYKDTDKNSYSDDSFVFGFVYGRSGAPVDTRLRIKPVNSQRVAE